MTPDWSIAYVALGSNLGDRAAHLRVAAAALARAQGSRALALSPLYETAAVADQPQPDYLNAVARLETTLAPGALLALCLGIEASMGRRRPAGQKKAPRIIDLDLLLHGDRVLELPGLRVPHPGLLERAFVRIPLADVAQPGLRHPVTGVALDLAGPDAEVRRYEEG